MYENEQNQFDYIRSPAPTYRNAVEGRHDDWRQDPRFPREGIPDHFANHSLNTYYTENTYLTITDSDKQRETELFNGFRFNESDFAYLYESDSTNKIYNNNGMSLYMVDV